MKLNLKPEAPPLVEDRNGTYRVGSSRVTLKVLLQSFAAGDTPEEIVEAFDTLNLADVYAIRAWCLRHREEVEQYEREIGALDDASHREARERNQPAYQRLAARRQARCSQS